MKRLILASKSPRRRELLAGLGIPFEVNVIPGIEETYPESLPAEQVPEFIAREKAAPYLNKLKEDDIVLTADTVVIVGQEILGKPIDEADACRMLRVLSGKTHQVVTGVCLSNARLSKSFSVKTDVTFKSLTEEEIQYYVSHYHPLDKAGAYGIQEWIGYIGCVGLRGSYYNVMGLPVQRIYEELTSEPAWGFSLT